DNNGGGNTQNQTISTQLRSSVTLSGALSNIYNPTSGSNTNTLLAAQIKSNLNSVFENGEALANVDDLEITVNGNFPTTSEWTGTTAFAGNNGWNATQGLTDVLYDWNTAALNISSLNDLKTQLTSEKITSIITEASSAPASGTVFTVVENSALGLTNNADSIDANASRDLLHIHVTGTEGSNTTNYDLQIPVSDLNLVVSDLTVTVTGTNVEQTGSTTTNFTYNIGINETANFVQPTQAPSINSADTNGDGNKALVALGYANESDGNYTLNNEAISAGIGVYNSEFSNPTIAATQGGSSNQFTITLSATPKEGYVWEDGTRDAKSISFPVTFTVTTA
ncbi:hypothetical protein D8X55_05105, partial [Malacoplasma penetrans]